MLNPRKQAFVVALRLLNYRTAQNCTAIEHVLNVLAFPTAATNYYKFGRSFTHLLYKPAPRM